MKWPNRVWYFNEHDKLVSREVEPSDWHRRSLAEELLFGTGDKSALIEQLDKATPEHMKQARMRYQWRGAA